MRPCGGRGERGVLFDIGHGMGAFNWTVGEICAEQGFWPDTISSDLHTGCFEGPAYDMPTVMTRMLHLGMPLAEVIRRSTIVPAAAIGWSDRIGTLGAGREADVAVLDLQEADMDLEDCQGQMRRVGRRLVATAVWRAGVWRPRSPNRAAFPTGAESRSPGRTGRNSRSVTHPSIEPRR